MYGILMMCLLSDKHFAVWAMFLVLLVKKMFLDDQSRQSKKPA